MTDLYETLNVNPDANGEDIKKAYRREAQRHHPDKNDGDDEQFHLVKLAYDVLSDSSRREKYDRTGDIHKAPTPRSLAEEKLAEMFNMLIEHQEFQGNILGKIRNAALVQIEAGKSAKRDAGRKVEVLKRQLKRIISKREVNLFDGILNERITALEDGRERISNDIDVWNDVLRLLDDYDDTQPTPEWQTFHTG
jgi:DnaJ-class molecular chaperone